MVDYAIWDELPFYDFEEKTLERKELWQKYAKQILEELPARNTALVAETSAGKTIIALLVFLAGNFRCLFLAPTRYLCGQHQGTFSQIIGNLSVSRVITGLTPEKSLIWDDPRDRIVFATPHMALAECKREKLDLNQFDLLVMDEFQNASGDYPYTGISEKTGPNMKILGMSALPGDNEEQIRDIGEACKIQNWIVADIPTPAKLRDLVVAEQDELIQKISGYLDGLLRNTLMHINELSPELKINPGKKHLFSYTETKKWEASAEKITSEKDRLRFISFVSKYRKLYHAYSTLIQESYATFLEYTEKLRTQESHAANSILRHPNFKKIIAIAKAELDNHPKVLMFQHALDQWVDINRNALVFIHQRATGEYLKDYLNNRHFRAQNVFGGSQAALRQQKEAFRKIACGELDIVVSTSVSQEGISVPEVNMVVNFSHPNRGVASQQREGRTARSGKGNVIDLVIDHPLDWTAYWISRRKAKQGKKAMAKIAEESKT